MLTYYGDKTGVVQSAKNLLDNLASGSQLTMTIIPERSEDAYVLHATIESWEDTELLTAKFYSQTQVNT